MKKLLFGCTFVLACLGLSWTAWGNAQQSATNISVLVKKGINHQLKGDYAEANTIGDQLIALYPNDAVGYVFNLNTLVVRFSWDLNSKIYDEQIQRYAQTAFKLCQNRINTDPLDHLGYYFCGQSHFTLTYFHAARGNYYQAGKNGTKTISFLEKTLALKPELIDAKLHLGVAYYYADNLPPLVRAFSRLLWFIPSGNSNKSLSYVKEVAENGDLFRETAKYLYSDLLMVGGEENWSRAGVVLADLVARYPQSRRFHLRYITYLVQSNRHSDALVAVDNFVQTDICCPRDSLDKKLARLWKARAHLGLDQVKATATELGSITQQELQMFPSWGQAWYALTQGQLSDLMLKRKEAQRFYGEVLTFTREGTIGASLEEAAEAGLKRPYTLELK